MMKAANQVNKNKTEPRQLFICTQLSVFSSDRHNYENEDYYKIASAGLNTDDKKVIFNKKELAEALLKKKGTFWCIYTVEIPSNVIRVEPHNGSISLKEDFYFSAENIKGIQFHPSFSMDPITHKPM